eukprot:15440930-Alexandrium_andersonii.AAC.1
MQRANHGTASGSFRRLSSNKNNAGMRRHALESTEQRLKRPPASDRRPLQARVVACQRFVYA